MFDQFLDAFIRQAANVIETIVAASNLRDKIFYDDSGGGLTFSGGEPTMQPEFLLECLAALKEKGIQTALETCGSFAEALIGALLECVDLFLYDIKHVDSEMHKRYTGVPNEHILDNFSRIVKRATSARIIPRIPVIPGFNTDIESIQKAIVFLQDTGYDGPIHLMPYNRMAKTKWLKIGRGDSYTDMGGLPDAVLESIESRFEQASFATFCNR